MSSLLLFNTHPQISTSKTDLCLRNVIQHANTRLLLLESTKLNLMLNLWSWFQSYYMPSYQGSFTFLNKCCIPLDITILDFPQGAFSFKSNTPGVGCNDQVTNVPSKAWLS